MAINSYPTVFAIGHKMIENLFDGEVLVEEKIDGSQFSFGVIDGELQCRSKGKQMILDAPENMFRKAIDTIKELETKCHPGWVYRCEYLEKPKHNVLNYSRIPNNYLIIFDIRIGEEEYLDDTAKSKEACRVGLECVPSLYKGKIKDLAFFMDLLETESILGGTKIEGVVIKNYGLFTAEKKIAIGKYVSEAFKEVAGGEWKKNNPGRQDIIDGLIKMYHTEARWNKAVQHLQENGILEGSPRDIGGLIRETQVDIKKECEGEIKEALFKHFWKQIERACVAGLPEWYKERLLNNAFEK